MTTRKEIRSLSPQELLDLRMAMISFQQNENEGGYHDLAGYHGLPHGYCPHGEPSLFLAWHRYYIYMFELELRKINPNLSLPYWDWTDQTTFSHCIAPAHSDKTFVDDKGKVTDNPLFSALTYGNTKMTVRNDGDLSSILAQAKFYVNSTLRSGISSLHDLGIRLKMPHDNIHVMVGGDFAQCDFAAYDPLFWSHHATVDRQWAIWQSRNPHYQPSADILNWDLKGFTGKKVEDVICYQTQLDCKYDNLDFEMPMDTSCSRHFTMQSFRQLRMQDIRQQHYTIIGNKRTR